MNFKIEYIFLIYLFNGVPLLGSENLEFRIQSIDNVSTLIRKIRGTLFSSGN